MFSLFNFSSIFPGGQLTPLPLCADAPGRAQGCVQQRDTCTDHETSVTMGRTLRPAEPRRRSCSARRRPIYNKTVETACSGNNCERLIIFRKCRTKHAGTNSQKPYRFTSKCCKLNLQLSLKFMEQPVGVLERLKLGACCPVLSTHEHTRISATAEATCVSRNLVDCCKIVRQLVQQIHDKSK